MKSHDAQIEINQLKKRGVLTENAVLRYLVFSALYACEGIPIGVLFYAIPAWLAMNGIAASDIASYVAMVTLPWSFKLIMAPLMDRYTWLPMGRKRPWIIFSQACLFLGFLAFGMVKDPLNELGLLMTLGFIVSLFGAMQDIGIDGMAVDVIPLNQQARANGVMWGSRVIGQSLALLGGTALINTIGFSNAITFMSFIIILLIMVPLFIRERPGEKLFPWTSGKPNETAVQAQSTNWKDLLKSLFKVTILPSSFLLAISMFIIGTFSGIYETLLPIFTVQNLGWTNTEFSNVYSLATIMAGFIGMFAGGVIIDLFGTKKMIAIILTFMSIVILSFSLVSSYWDSTFIIYSFVILYSLSITLYNIAAIALSMKLSWNKISATQFTLFMMMNNLGISAGAIIYGWVQEKFSWPLIFIFTLTFIVFGLLTFRFIKIKKHLETIEFFNQSSKKHESGK
ncbi:MFS transporter [Mangrovimonas futianensis]|uniref:MFS transporter n=1 Tax=Mangrovimonas futianensis TaxID=2895523 RepID=UPI001E653197|nr:MFS transporter [Mangrovimonas futianensis]MCF1423117.1 MFS transporter [Mangrovimonas futianensis]